MLVVGSVALAAKAWLEGRLGAFRLGGIGGVWLQELFDKKEFLKEFNCFD